MSDPQSPAPEQKQKGPAPTPIPAPRKVQAGDRGYVKPVFTVKKVEGDRLTLAWTIDGGETSQEGVFLLSQFRLAP